MTGKASTDKMDSPVARNGPLSSTEEEELMPAERQSLLTQVQFIENYRGFINVGIILLVLSNVRLIAENLLKYGVLMKFNLLKVQDVTDWPIARLSASM